MVSGPLLVVWIWHYRKHNYGDDIVFKDGLVENWESAKLLGF
jgi:hypothetical protein